jgi:hypothetical protein
MIRVDPQAERLQARLDRLAAGVPGAAAGEAIQDDPELAELVRLAVRLAEVAPVKAPPAYRAREQLLLQAATPPRRRDGDRSPAARWMLRLAGALAAVALAVGTVVVASADSLPGEVLYPVKRAAEGARLALAADPVARARLRLVLAGERRSEIQALAGRGEWVEASALAGLVEARQAALGAARATGDPRLVAAVKHAAEADLEALGRLLAGAPAGTRVGWGRAIRQLKGLVAATAPADPAPAPLPLGRQPPAGAPAAPAIVPAAATVGPTAQPRPTVRSAEATVPPLAPLPTLGVPAAPPAGGAAGAPPAPPPVGPATAGLPGAEPTSRFKKQREDDLATERAQAAPPTSLPEPTRPAAPQATPPGEATAPSGPGDRPSAEPPTAPAP